MDIEILALKFYDYSLYIRGYTKPTVRSYKSAISFYCKFANITQIDQVTEKNVREFFLYGRTERKWQSNSFTTIYMSLMSFFRWCVEQKYLKTNPIIGIELPKLEKKLPAKLTKQEALRLLEIVFNYPYDYTFLRHRNHAMFSTFLFAGLRKHELLHLRLTDVDIENLTLFIHQGKGNKDRVVPISYTLAQSLKRYLEERNRLNKTCPEFFVSLNRNMGYTTHGLKRLVVQMRQVSNIKFTIHKLRHTFATLMLEGGCDIYSLSKMMGHSDIKTTTIYLAASAEHLRSQMTKHPLNDLI
ncbi:MAG TPA: tyrosine-type recombinase/integrase [Candidatus Paceibacterota bacterium]|jgi:site-specific recombinase XerD|nr:tyrosine-type recombinase/integrase [Candidatus Paceibacterota bacterium]